MGPDSTVAKEIKLRVAGDILSSYVRGLGASGNTMTPADMADMLKALYTQIEALFPEPEKRKVGLG
jgi:hypothetical protein